MGNSFSHVTMQNICIISNSYFLNFLSHYEDSKILNI